MKKLILFIGFLILLTFLCFIYLIFRDIPQIDDSDLLLSKVEISQEENAYYSLKEAISKIYIPRGKQKIFNDIAYKDFWDEDFVKELLERNEEVFEIFEKAVEYKYFQFPNLESSSYRFLSNESKNFLSRLSDLRKLIIIKSKNLLNQDKEKEALDLIIKLIKIGHMIEESSTNDYIIYSFGVQVKRDGLNAFIKMIPDLSFSKEISKDYINKLENFKENKEGLIRATKGEYENYLKEKEALEEFLKNEVIFAYFSYKPNKTKKLMTDFYRDVINKINKDCHEIKNETYKPKEFPLKTKMLFIGNALGKNLYEKKVSNAYLLLEIKCSEVLYIEAVKTLLALKAYKIDKGELPESLEALVPEYLIVLPKDPFDGKTLKYSPKEKIIYSINGERFSIDF